MFVAAVFVRRLKEGVTFEEFEAVWAADTGYGVATRVFNAVSFEDPRDVLSVGLLDIPDEALESMAEAAANQDQDRHDRVDDVIESTELKAMFEVKSEHDFTNEPRAIEMAIGESLLTNLRL